MEETKNLINLITFQQDKLNQLEKENEELKSDKTPKWRWQWYDLELQKAEKEIAKLKEEKSKLKKDCDDLVIGYEALLNHITIQNVQIEALGGKNETD
tara:strand:+ start:774 stop:1067 length:294 start_codon:yes stop_codon:yes gene_type:complete